MAGKYRASFIRWHTHAEVLKITEAALYPTVVNPSYSIKVTTNKLEMSFYITKARAT
jgi:hypothetical protein